MAKLLLQLIISNEMMISESKKISYCDILQNFHNAVNHKRKKH